MATNTYLSTTDSKKLRKQEEQRQSHGYREYLGGCQIGRDYGGTGEELRGVRSTNG